MGINEVAFKFHRDQDAVKIGVRHHIPNSYKVSDTNCPAPPVVQF